MCTRCVRFTREISGTAELQVIDRGTHEEIDIFPGEPCNNKLAGNVVDLCPVGALCSKDFLYKQRVWWLKSDEAASAPAAARAAASRSIRTKTSRLSPEAARQSAGAGALHVRRRPLRLEVHPRAKSASPIPEQREAGQRGLARLGRHPAGALQAAASAAQESHRRFARRALAVDDGRRSVSAGELPQGDFAEGEAGVGPGSVVGEDDKYPKDVRGQAIEPTKFTIRAEKAPNRRGVEAVLKHFTKSPLSIERSAGQAASGELDVLYLVGGDPNGWITDATGRRCRRSAPLVVVQDMLPSPVSQRRTFLLAGGSFAERDGTFVNHAGLAQEIRRSVRGPDGARPDGRILWDLAGRTGLVQRRRSCAKKSPRQIPALAALARGQARRPRRAVTAKEKLRRRQQLT